MAEIQQIDSLSGSRAPKELDDIRALVQALIQDKEQYEKVLEARGDDAQCVLDTLQVVSRSLGTRFNPYTIALMRAINS